MADEKKVPKEEAKSPAKKAAPPKAEAGGAPKKAAAKVAKEDAPKKAAPPAPRDEKDEAEEEEEAREGQEETQEEAPAKPRKAKAASKRDEEKDEEEEEDEEAAPKRSKRPRPTLAPQVARALKIRAEKSHDRPNFYRQEWFRYQRLGKKWRFPQGIQSKMRRHWKTHADVVSIGHRGPAVARGLHPSGFREVLVHNPDALTGIDPKKEAVRIAKSVGWQNRDTIQKKARKLGIRVLNWKEERNR